MHSFVRLGVRSSKKINWRADLHSIGHAFVVGQEMLQKRERHPSLLRSTFLVPLWVVCALALRGVMSFGDIAT